MQRAFRFIAVPLVAAGLIASAGLARAGNATLQLVKPYEAISLDLGSKRITGYFLTAGEGRCNLTVMVGDAWREDREPSSSAVLRVQMTVEGDKPAHLDTGEGKVVRFDCQGGQAMNATLSDQVAYFAPAK